MPVTLSLSVQNVSCESCGKVISRLISRFKEAKFESISSDANTLTLTCRENDVDAIKEVLREYNYLAGSSVSQIRHVAKGVLSGKNSFLAENVFLTRLFLVFGALFVLTALFQFFVFNKLSVGINLWPVLALVPFGIVLNMASLWHARLLGENFLCNTGMMIGMTIGMMSGFMLGVLLGATNGMFVGSVTAMLIGMGAGAWAGRSVGIMGIMEGMMAGLMGGLMGPMLSVMLVADNLVLFLYLFFAACTIIIAGLSYMIYKEAGPILDEASVPSFLTLLFAGLIVLVFVVALAVFGPKSAIAFGAG